MDGDRERLMTQVKWRDLRESLADIIARARSGERMQITRHGKVVAVIGPPETRTCFYKQTSEAVRSDSLMTG
jgi:prevent-host-death family protein